MSIEKNRIILFSPQPVATGRRVLLINLLAVVSFLAEEKGKYNIQIFHSYDQDEYLEAIRNLDDVLCIGISAMTGYQITDGLRFAKMVKEEPNSPPIVWGGVHATILPLQTIKDPYVDIIVKGQGEITFYELVRCLQSRGDLKDVLGIVYKKNGEIIENDNRPMADIADFPQLPYHLLGDKIERYIKSLAYSIRSLPIITSDGCPYNCSFCYLSTPQFKRKYTAHEVSRVLDHIELLVNNYNIGCIDIRDTNFFIDTVRTRAILEGLIKRNIRVSLAEVNVRADQLLKLDDDYWQLMEEAGVKEILIGTESGDQDMLDLVNKRISIDQIIECEKKAARYKINVMNSFITCFPIKSINKKTDFKKLNKELYNTVDLINKIYKINQLSTNMLFIYIPYPGTPLYKYCLECGFNEPDSFKTWGIIGQGEKYFPWMSDGHINKVHYFEKLITLRKITSRSYRDSQRSRGNNKHQLLAALGLLRLLNLIVAFRLKFKVTILPFEKYI